MSVFMIILDSLRPSLKTDEVLYEDLNIVTDFFFFFFFCDTQLVSCDFYLILIIFSPQSHYPNIFVKL